MRSKDWSSDVCSSDLVADGRDRRLGRADQPRNLAVGDVGMIAHDPGDAVRLVLPLGHRRIARPLGTAHLRSEEHTSELQSLMRISYAVFCLKNKTNHKEHVFTPDQPPNLVFRHSN